MRLALFVLVSVLVAASYGQLHPYNRWGSYSDPGHYYFRDAYSPPKVYGSQSPPALTQQQNPSGRLFFTTVTLTMATVTVSTVSTAVTTCTSVAPEASTSCSPAARRRRGSAAAQLFFKEDDESIPLPDSINDEEQPAIAPRARKTEKQSVNNVPYVIQPGFNGPETVGSGRIMLAFFTSTVTTTSITTSITTLAAVCLSTTNWQTCGSTG